MEIARGTDLPDLLSALGYQVLRIGHYHTTKEMDSLRIKNRRTWYRYSEKVGGDAITFLQHFCGKSFPEAVEYLLDFHGRIRDAPAAQPEHRLSTVSEEPPKPFKLPEAHGDQRRVFAYLRKRGIASQVIRSFIVGGLLYWVLYSGNEKRMEVFRNTAPQTYAYMEKLAASNWGC